MGDILSLLVLVISLIVTAAVQTVLALGAMLAIHKIPSIAKQLREKTYSQFDFDNFQRAAFNEMLTRLALIFLGPTVVFHLGEYLLFGMYGMRRHNVFLSIFLLILETTAIAIGFTNIMKLDKLRTTILTVASTVFYLILYWTFLYWELS